jgi:hypothetical protein
VTTLSQRSFTGGELSPAVSARADLAKYQTGLSTLRNFFVMKHGGISNRAGTQFVCEVSDSTRAVRLIDFVFSLDQSYVLEFGHLYMRVIRNGVLLSTISSFIVSNIDIAAQATVTHPTHGYTTGDEVRYYGLRGGMTSMNGRIFTIEVVDANSYKLKLRGVYFSTIGMTFTGGAPYASAYKIYKIASQYEEDDLATLNYAQSADVMTLTHPNYPITELSRTGHTSWSFSEVTTEPVTAPPSTIAITVAGSGGTSQTLKYKVTSIDPDTREESYAGYSGLQTTTAMTNAAPGLFTTAVHGWNDDDELYFYSTHPSFTQYNGYYQIDVQSTTTFFLKNQDGIGNVDTTLWAAFPGSGFISFQRTHQQVVGAPSIATPTTLTWSAPLGITEFNIYKALNGVYGWIGTSQSATFNDTGITPDITDTVPIRRNPFADAGDYPATVNFYQQRRMFAASDNSPQTVWGSRTGNFKNFTVSSPIQDDDSVQFDLLGKRVNRIKHMLDLGQLLILTSDGEFAVNGNESGVLGPSDINAKQYTYNGCGDLAPIVIDSSAIYLQARGTIIRDLGYDYESNGYRGNDLTIFSAHLFEKYQIVDWAYQKTPHSIVWAARDDGTLLGLTYIREQELLAWHRHDIQGSSVENTCVIPEDANDMLYMAANLTVDGEQRRYILRMSTRNFEDVAVDCTILDAFLTYDGRNGNLGFVGATTMTLSGGTTWSADELLTLTAADAMFNTVADDIGNEIHLKVGDDVLRCVIVDDASNTSLHVKVRAHKTVPAAFRGVAVSDWNRAVDRVEGLWHLEGKEVSIFADGFVVANPNNKSYVVLTVTDGAIDLPQCYGVIHVGLPMTSDFQTLDVEFANAETMVSKKINIGKVNLKVLDSRGIFVGPTKPTDAEELSSATFLKGLVEEKIRQYEGYDSPVALKTGEFNITIPGQWKSNGRVFGRNTDPIPCTILSIHPEGNIPIKGVG